MTSAKGGSWVLDRTSGALIPKNEYLQARADATEHRRSALSCPMIINDSLDDLYSHADGRRYTSKRAYERAVKAAGCQIVGNENPAAHTAKPIDDAKHEAEIVADVGKAIAEVKNRS